MFSSKTAKKSPLQRTLKAQQEMNQQKAKLQKDNRDRLCVPPKYTGSPEQYVYVPAREYCVKKNAKPKENSRISAAQNRAEVKIIDKILADRDKTHKKISGLRGDDVLHMTTVYGLMITTKLRLLHKNPLDRYAYIVDDVILKQLKVKVNSDIFDAIFEMLKAHIKNLH